MPARIGIDETSLKMRHDYVTAICDLDARKAGGVMYVADDRKETSVTPLFERLGQWGRRAIKHIAMDMFPPNINAARAALDEAEQRIGFDKFRIAEHLGDAVNQIRLQEHRALTAGGDHRLARTKYN